MINIGMHHKVIYKEPRHDKEAISKNSIIENTYEQIYTATIIQINNGKLQPRQPVSYKVITYVSTGT